MIGAVVALLLATAAPDILATATPDERQFLACVAQHESHGNPRAQDPRSTASGRYSFIDSTWLGVAKWAKWDDFYPARPYPKARLAPAWVQDLAALHVVRHGGFHAWHGTGCKLNGRTA